MQTLPTDYSHQQLVDALSAEYEFLCHDDFDPDVDMSPADYRADISTLSHAELVSRTDTDDTFTLSDFMSTYGWCLPPAFTVGCRLHVYYYSPLFHIHMFTYQSSSFISYIFTDVLRGTCNVMMKNGSYYRYTNVSRRALLNLDYNPSISLGLWFNRNCVNATRTNQEFKLQLSAAWSN